MATIEELSAALVKADAAGNAADAKAFADAIRQMRGSETVAPVPQQPETGIPGPRQPGFVQRALDVVAQTPRTAFGLLEVPTTMATGALGQLVGVPVGIASTFGEGFGTPQAVQRGQQLAGKIAGAMTYRPQTEVGQTLVGAMAKPFEGMPPIIGGNLGAGAATLAPAATRQAFQAGQKFLAPSETKLARMTAEDYARGGQIDAAADAQRLNILLRPTDIQSTAGPRITETVAGRKGGEKVVEANKAQVRKVQLADMGMPETAPLNKATTFDQARANVAKPYDEVAKLPTMTANENTVSQLQGIRKTQDLIGTKEYAAAIDNLVDEALAQTQKGMNGATVKDNISTLRADAKKVYNNPNATLAEQHVADARLAIANTLESMIESNIADPKLLSRFRDARQKMARIYAYEAATDLNTGLLDVKKLSRITAKDNSLTGDIAALGRIAGNFPHAFEVKPKGSWVKGAAVELGRSTPPGALGGLAGFQLTNDYTGAIVGSLAGALGGKVAQNYAANMLASPAYQAALKLRDLRAPQLTPAEINYTSNMLAPYQPEVLGPSGEGATGRLRIVGYDENDRPIYAPARQGPQQGFTMPPQPTYGAAPTPYAQRSLPNEIPRQTYEAQKRAELAQGFREAAERQPTAGEVILEFDPITGRFREASQGLKGATPETFSNFGSALQTAADKVTTGKRFDLTATEKVAWDKTKVDLAEVAPGFKALSDKAVAEKMMDRAWVEQTAKQAREKAAAFEQIAARAKDERARQTAIANRERMMDLAEQMEDTLRAPRPVSTGGQGPKTRAFQRNRLIITPDENVNALSR